MTQFAYVRISINGFGTTKPDIGEYPYKFYRNDKLEIKATPEQGWHFAKAKVNHTEITSNPIIISLGSQNNILIIFEKGEPIPPPPPPPPTPPLTSDMMDPSPDIIVPKSHQDIATRIKISYPWFPQLKKKCVFVGKDAIVNTETGWLVIWDDGQSVDVAAVFTMIDAGPDSNMVGITFARMDDGEVDEGGEQLIVEIDGIVYSAIFTQPKALKGYWCITTNKV